MWSKQHESMALSCLILKDGSGLVAKRVFLQHILGLLNPTAYCTTTGLNQNKQHKHSHLVSKIQGTLQSTAILTTCLSVTTQSI